MRKALGIIIVGMALTGCQSMNVIEGANLAKNIAGLSKAGITEELVVATKDAIDPVRGGGKWKQY